MILSLDPSMTSVAEIAEKLHSRHPFDLVPTASLQTIAGLVAEMQVPGGTIVLPASAAPQDLYIIVEGSVEVMTDGKVGETLVHDEAFPLEALQTRDRPLVCGSDHVARTDVSLLMISAAAIAQLRFTCPEFDEYCVHHNVLHQQSSTMADISGIRSALNLDLHRLLPHRPMPTVGPTISIHDVVHILHDTKSREVIVVDDGIPLGIFTRSDLVDRVLVPEISLDSPITQAMTPNPITLPETSLGSDAVIEMHRRGISRVVLLDANGHYAGVISDSDLLYALQDSSNLHYIIMHAQNETDLVRSANKIRELATGLMDEGVEADHLTKLVSTLNDHLGTRIVTLCAEKYGISQDHFCWVALGSEGRHEQTLHTDQDNALIFVCDDPDQLETTRQTMLTFAKEVNTILDKCGFPLCSGNIMSSNPECCLTPDEWRHRFAEWVHEPKPVALLNATIYFDLRPLCGNTQLCDDLITWLLDAVHNHKRFFHLMMDGALQRKPPIGLLRNFTVDSSDSCLDIKLSGIALLVDGARILGLATGCRSSSTAERLRSGADAKILSQEEADNLQASFAIMQRVRMRSHHDQISRGLPPSNRVNPYNLNNFDRKDLLEAFRHANNLQKVIGNRFSLEMRR